jgi:hypothetical protein
MEAERVASPRKIRVYRLWHYRREKSRKNRKELKGKARKKTSKCIHPSPVAAGYGEQENQKYRAKYKKTDYHANT